MSEASERTVGRLERVPLRTVWPHEAVDFTRWLEENPDVISEVLDFELRNLERERAAGAFSVDLTGEDEDGRPVVIENQLERSDHDHLGKLITYLTAFDAARAVWVVADPRPEHVGAITWLNESSSASFYLLKVEAVRIMGSPAAPLVTLIVGPSAETRRVSASKQERAERHDIREAFWAGLLERARERTRLHAGISPSTDSWISAGSGTSGVRFMYSIRQRDSGVHVYLERPSAEENHALLRALEEHREEIEVAFGGSLDWDHREGRKRCSLGVVLEGGGYREPEERWVAIQDRMIDAMCRLEPAVRPHLAAATSVLR
jgi:hypothetical protein